MKPILIILMIVLSLFSVQKTFALEWYEGGTLHKGKGVDWNVATNRDRLATSADFIANIMPDFTRKHIATSKQYLVRDKAIQLNTCITSTTKHGTGEDVAAVELIDNLAVIELAAMCAGLLGFHKK